jgi:hypothetical protein
MAIFFRTSIDENSAFERIDDALSSGQSFDGYFSIHGDLTFSRPSDMRADEFRQQITDALRSVWETSQFWTIYVCDGQNGLTVNEVTAAAVRLSANYCGAVIVTLSILGRASSSSDLELIFLCFSQESERRNFRARYEGKFVSK